MKTYTKDTLKETTRALIEELKAAVLRGQIDENELGELLGWLHDIMERD